MKKFSLVLAMITFSALASFAQPLFTNAAAYQEVQQDKPATLQERAERVTRRMTEQLGLTADQTTKIQAINLQRITEQQALRQKRHANADREAMMKDMRALQQKYQEQYKGVLTPEQYAILEANQNQGGGGRNGNDGPRRRPSRLDQQ